MKNPTANSARREEGSTLGCRFPKDSVFHALNVMARHEVGRHGLDGEHLVGIFPSATMRARSSCARAPRKRWCRKS